ncbi:hypothetical protein AAF712_006054 [Marasmius tenuissimus]|uniref:DRBM domain-containing protein n=1 Tax=Marasmius tenuissimus TaxID=585030 RepID=A0ABR3A0E9_9AGAR
MADRGHPKTALNNYCQANGKTCTYEDCFRGSQNNGFWYSVAIVDGYKAGVGEPQRKLLDAQQSAARKALEYYELSA